MAQDYRPPLLNIPNTIVSRISRPIRSMLQRYVLEDDEIPHAVHGTVNIRFNERMRDEDYVIAQAYYPVNLLDALVELFQTYDYNISIVDDWIMIAFAGEGLVHGQPFTVLSRYTKEDIKERLIMNMSASASA
jgi:hypothetical protein